MSSLFSHSKENQQKEDVDLAALSFAYRCLEEGGWQYNEHNLIEAGAGGELITACLNNHNVLKHLMAKIVKHIDSDAAKDASLLFERLYKHGFSKGLFREDMRRNFIRVLPEADLDLISKHDKTLFDCLKEQAEALHQVSAIRRHRSFG